VRLPMPTCFHSHQPELVGETLAVKVLKRSWLSQQCTTEDCHLLLAKIQTGSTAWKHINIHNKTNILIGTYRKLNKYCKVSNCIVRSSDPRIFYKLVMARTCRSKCTKLYNEKFYDAESSFDTMRLSFERLPFDFSGPGPP